MKTSKLRNSDLVVGLGVVRVGQSVVVPLLGSIDSEITLLEWDDSVLGIVQALEISMRSSSTQEAALRADAVRLLRWGLTDELRV